MSENRELFDAEDIVGSEEELNTEAAAASENEGTENTLDSTEAPKKRFAEAHELVSSLVYAVLFMLALNLFVFRSITVDGGSMLNTLQNADRVISTNLFYTPQRGDIVVIQADRLQNRMLSGKYETVICGEPIIKRVIALEGDTIRFDFDAGKVYLNGEELEEDYIATPTNAEWDSVSGKDYVVPDGCVFVMGDNRNGSTDSRDNRVGFIDTDLIMGKAIFRFFPFDTMGLL